MVYKLFLDVNVLLDFFLKRGDHQNVKQILLLASERKINLYISSSVIQTVAYYLQKSYDVPTGKHLLLELLKLTNVIEASHETVYQALNSSFNDIEDAIHYFAAIKYKIDYLISNDKQFQQAALSSLPVLSVAELIKRLQQVLHF